MNIVIINGSPRANGATAKILHVIEERLIQRENILVEFVDISNLKMSPCTGCCVCYKTGCCYMDDKAEELSNKIAMADGLIIGSPTYASNVSGQLKQFIDRGHFVIEQLLHNKYAVSVVTGENYGSRDTSKILNKLLKYSGASLSGNIRLDLPFNQNPNGSNKLKKKACALADKLYYDVKRKRKYLFQCFIHKLIFSLGIKSFVMKKGESYSGVVLRWRSCGVIID